MNCQHVNKDQNTNKSKNVKHKLYIRLLLFKWEKNKNEIV